MVFGRLVCWYLWIGLLLLRFFIIVSFSRCFFSSLVRCSSVVLCLVGVCEC